jgi:hypothetical protein
VSKSYSQYVCHWEWGVFMFFLTPYSWSHHRVTFFGSTWVWAQASCFLIKCFIVWVRSLGFFDFVYFSSRVSHFLFYFSGTEVPSQSLELTTTWAMPPAQALCFLPGMGL